MNGLAGSELTVTFVWARLTLACARRGKVNTNTAGLFAEETINNMNNLSNSCSKEKKFIILVTPLQKKQNSLLRHLWHLLFVS